MARPARTEILTATTAPVTVVEPVLDGDQVGEQRDIDAGNPAGGGDVLEYVVTIPNSGTATAHDVNVVDTLPAGLSLDGGFIPTAIINGAAAAGFVATPANAPSGPLIWGRDNGDGSLDIPVGQSLVLTYRVVVREWEAVSATACMLTGPPWTASTVYERTGAGCPLWTAPNDYCTGPAVATTTTVDDNNIVKTITADT